MPGFEVEETTTFSMREKLADIDGDSFIIKDENGNEVLEVSGNALSIRENKVLKDMEGNEFYRINEELVNFDIRECQYIRDAESDEILFTLRQAGLLLGRNTVDVFEGDSEDGDPLYKISGEFFEKEFDVKNSDDELVAEIDRNRLANIITDKDTYAITVEGGQDAALMIAFAVAIDEIFRD